MAEDAASAYRPAKLGLAFENRWMERIIETLGVPAAAELLFTARTFDGAAAQRMGFAHAVMPGDELGGYVDDLAQGIAALAPLTLRAAKAGLRAIALDDAAAGVQAEALVVTCATSNDYQRALEAFRNRKRPEFKGD